MAQSSPSQNLWNGRRIAITGGRGSLGRALTQALRQCGADVTGLTHSTPPPNAPSGPNRWVQWTCGEEDRLDSCLEAIDILVVNHGINPQGAQSIEVVNKALEINALSSWRLMQRFERLACNRKREHPREVWVNTSEAEFQPAISPVYELSKRLLGQLVSLRGAVLSPEQRERLVIRKLVLGPFRSELNPIGVMTPSFVASQILLQARLGARLIIVTPNPITYLTMPLIELGRRLYSRWLNHRDP